MSHNSLELLILTELMHNPIITTNFIWLTFTMINHQNDQYVKLHSVSSFFNLAPIVRWSRHSICPHNNICFRCHARHFPLVFSILFSMIMTGANNIYISLPTNETCVQLSTSRLCQMRACARSIFSHTRWCLKLVNTIIRTRPSVSSTSRISSLLFTLLRNWEVEVRKD